MDELTRFHELTLFRDFRSDTPGPSAAETEAARARLLDAIAGQGPAAARPASSRRRWACLGRFARPRFWAPLAAAVAVVAVAITMVLLAVPGSTPQKQKPPTHQRHHTSHQKHGTSKFANPHGTGSRAAGQHAGTGAASPGAPGKSSAPGSSGSGGSGPATPTTTALTVSPGAAFSAHQVTMTATVTDQAGGNLTGGGVTFTLYPNETVSPASALDVCAGAPVTGNVATCTYTPTSADAGTYVVRAQYGGYQQYESSGSAAASLTVTAIGTVTTLTVGPAAADPGQTVTLTATVTDQAGDNLSGGTVGFFWSPAPVDGVGAAASVDICLDSPLTYDPATHDNVATCQYTIPSAMTAGTLDMQAEYADPAGLYPESMSGTVAFTVQS